MAALETIDSLTPKLGATLTTLRTVEQLYTDGISSVRRGLYRLCEWLPLGVIPLSLIWSGVILFAHAEDPMHLVLIFSLGLLAILGSTALLFALRRVLDEMHLPDAILGGIIQNSNLAYHPNSVLRRCVARRGYATLGEFRVWVAKQREILNNRANDFTATLESLRKGPPLCRLEQIAPGARAFLDG
jgi:hypothetical protein